MGVGGRGVGGEGGGRGWKVITVRNDTKAAVTSLLLCLTINGQYV